MEKFPPFCLKKKVFQRRRLFRNLYRAREAPKMKKSHYCTSLFFFFSLCFQDDQLNGAKYFKRWPQQQQQHLQQQQLHGQGKVLGARVAGLRKLQKTSLQRKKASPLLLLLLLPSTNQIPNPHCLLLLTSLSAYSFLVSSYSYSRRKKHQKKELAVVVG